jgi:hypothetical protein
LERYTTTTGEEKISAAVCFVAQDITPGSWLAKGTYTEEDPRDVPEAFPVAVATEIPSVRGDRAVVRKVILGRG